MRIYKIAVQKREDSLQGINGKYEKSDLFICYGLMIFLLEKSWNKYKIDEFWIVPGNFDHVIKG